MQIFSQLIINYIVLTNCVSSFAEELKLIQVLFRHGERSPDNQSRAYYPLDEYTNETWYPEGWDNLTNDGKKNVYKLGIFLREKYGNWLGNIYLEDNVVFRSSSVSRNIMSTQIVAAALFPPNELQRWDSELNWQPIPVFTDPSKLRSLYIGALACRRILAMRRELEENDEFLVRRAEELKEFFDFVGRNVGYKVKQRHIYIIYHYLYGLLNKNVKLPEWTKGIFPEGNLERIAAYDYVIQSYNKSLIQLNGGQWIREWLKNVDDYISESSRHEYPKGYFYGVHEINISGILYALGIFDHHIPFYCSALIFELYKTDDEYHIKILHRNKGVLRDQILIPGCGNDNGTKCSLDNFRKLVADVIPTDDMISVCEKNTR